MMLTSRLASDGQALAHCAQMPETTAWLANGSLLTPP
jgi:hypothetical protein